MLGAIHLANKAGRALRQKAAPVYMRDVLYCCGSFAAGDPIYVAFLGADGGQYVVAMGVAQAGVFELRDKIGPPSADAFARPCDSSNQSVMVLERDVRLLWPPRANASVLSANASPDATT
jgi:hypothetical protein